MPQDSLNPEQIELLITNYNNFDLAIITIILISGMLSFGRGLIREAFAIMAFVFGGIGALWTLRNFRQIAHDMLPEQWSGQVIDGIILVFGFLIAYAVSTACGRKIAEMVRTVPEMGLLDRLGGAAFGSLRGFMIIVFLLMGMQQIVTPAMTPNFITQAKLYPKLDQAAQWTGARLPGIYQQAMAMAPETSPEN